MGNLHTRGLLLSFLLVLRLSSAFLPTDNHLLNCGASTTTTLDDHRVFVPDSSSLLLSGPKISVSDKSASPGSPALYHTARVFTRPASYRFEIKNKGTHLVRLHFYAFSAESHDLARARFHVTASGTVLLSDFQIGPKDSPLVLKEYLLRVEASELVITFIPVCGSSFGFVNAIEVVSAPADLVPDVARLVVAPDHVDNVNGILKLDFETLFRINVGGHKVTPFNDTLWRTWVPDDAFVKPSSSSETVYFSGRIQYQKYGATREVAPDNVYNTARVMKVENFSLPNSNMTWVFSVPRGYRYLIRLHFCDIASLALNELYFNIYINGYSAYDDFDLSKSTGWTLASPYYVDFIAEPDVLGQLSLTIAPSKTSIPSKVNGLLNGLEIMKMSNSAGNLDEKFMMNGVMDAEDTGVVGAFTRMVLCLIVFVALVSAGYIVVLRWRNASKISAGWSPLPMQVYEGKVAFGHPVTAK